MGNRLDSLIDQFSTVGDTRKDVDEIEEARAAWEKSKKENGEFHSITSTAHRKYRKLKEARGDALPIPAGIEVRPDVSLDKEQLYWDGHEDGMNGKTPELPRDKDYMQGHRDGSAEREKKKTRK